MRNNKSSLPGTLDYEFLNKSTQAVHFHCISLASVYYSGRKPKNTKRGRPGNEASISL